MGEDIAIQYKKGDLIIGTARIDDTYNVRCVAQALMDFNGTQLYLHWMAEQQSLDEIDHDHSLFFQWLVDNQYIKRLPHRLMELGYPWTRLISDGRD